MSPSSPAQTITLTQLPTQGDIQPIDGAEASHEPLDVNFAEDEQAAGTCSQYPRADGGKDAWLFLAGCFAVEMLVWYVQLKPYCSALQWPSTPYEDMRMARNGSAGVNSYKFEHPLADMKAFVGGLLILCVEP